MGSKTPRGVTTQVVSVTELPVVTSVGLAKHGKGWVVVMLKTQGDTVLDREVVSADPEPLGHAVVRGEVEFRKRFTAALLGAKS